MKTHVFSVLFHGPSTAFFVLQTTHPSSSGTEDKSLCDTFLEKALKENIRARAQRLINKIQTLSHLKGGEITSVEPHVFFSSTGRQHMPASLSHPAREGNEPKPRRFTHLPPIDTSTPQDYKPAGEARPPLEPTPPPCNTRTRGSSPLAMCAHFSLAQELVSQRGREKGEARGGRAAHRRRHKPCGALTKERGGGRGSRDRRAHGARGRTKGSGPAAAPRGWQEGWGGHGRAHAAGTRVHRATGTGTPGPRVPPPRAGEPRQGPRRAPAGGQRDDPRAGRGATLPRGGPFVRPPPHRTPRYRGEQRSHLLARPLLFHRGPAEIARETEREKRARSGRRTAS